MSYFENLSDGEYEAAVAAAAYAITTMEGEGDSLKQKKSAAGLARAKSKLGEKSSRSSFNWSFKWLSGKDTKEGEKETGDTIWHNAVEVERATTGSYSGRYSNAGEEADSSPTFKKMPTFTRKYTSEKEPKRLQSGKDIMEGIKVPSTSKPTDFSSGKKSWDKDSNELGRIETEADAWEKAEMIKAKNRYEKMLTVISQWQIEKKEKARRQMEKKEGGPAYKRAKALQRYNNEISRIDKIAGEAKALARERKQNDEAKIREKVAKIRLTGKMPGDCCSCL